jgi:hypothetical protein
MSLSKNRPKCSPISFCQNYVAHNFFRRKKLPINLDYLCLEFPIVAKVNNHPVVESSTNLVTLLERLCLGSKSTISTRKKTFVVSSPGNRGQGNCFGNWRPGFVPSSGYFFLPKLSFLTSIEKYVT